MKSIRLPGNLESMGKSALSVCRSLGYVVFESVSSFHAVLEQSTDRGFWDYLGLGALGDAPGIRVLQDGKLVEYLEEGEEIQPVEAAAGRNQTGPSGKCNVW
jgi:hypothetical protein